MRKIIPTKIKNDMAVGMPKIRYPSFGIDIKHLPEAKDWEIGDKYIITLKVKMTGISINEEKNNKERGYVDFDIKEIEVPKSKKDYKLLYKD